jgi:hypothetical protein
MIGARSNATFEHIYSEDPALDGESPAFDAKKYMDTFDRQYLPVREGSTPTIFRIRRLSRKRFESVSALNGHNRAASVVAYGVQGIENFRLPSGDMLIPEFTGQGSDTHLTPATLDAFFDGGLFAELMNVIIAASGLDPLANGR